MPHLQILSGHVLPGICCSCAALAVEMEKSNEVNAIFPLTDPTCLAAFSPNDVRPPPPAPNDVQNTGPEVDLDTLLNARF